MDFSIISVFMHASIFAKFLMVFLIIMSIASWAVVVNKWLVFRRIASENENFMKIFWSQRTFDQISMSAENMRSPLADIFRITYKNFSDFQGAGADADQQMIFAERIIRAESILKIREMEASLNVLAITASSSPFIGLLGTVWGIIKSFHEIGSMKSATLAVVAPGISEALVATALGLFVAIPAVIFYNIYANRVKEETAAMEGFADELLALLMKRR
ncbi:MotA/TolQ/ExbB proton channel family protein [Chrysiogenes arsenatis]|uniref:MotA/TolQ/ExbB proton channel family protein n=1 Tax=Chrysiogenes arsenatis TaxID=309797 RepID=UPI000418D4B8|nr:MotA/TolQ/ExbB proton channel family protein [Chrysiogenes arsenatis]